MSAVDRELARRRAITLAILVVGYSGYYLCRSNYSVCLPLLMEELGGRGMSLDAARLRLGEIASLGVLAYALGKFANGTLTDFLGGRRAFLSGMGLSVLCTVVLALSGALPVFSLAWIGNRLFQSMGWPGIVKVTSRWFAWSSHARAMALLSLSFLFGDALARVAMGGLIGAGLGWRPVFLSTAGVLAVIFAVAAWGLRESPADHALPEPGPHPDNLFGADPGAPAAPDGLRALLGPLLSSRAFWAVCALSLGLTLVRETFNTWTPSYFVEAVGLDPGAAARWSAIFPAFGGVSVLLAGWLGDRFGARGRARVIVGGLTLSALSLLALGRMAGELGPAAGIGLVGLTAFLLIGPYSYLAGGISLDFGGKQGSATACGIIDGVGYLGGVLAGGGVASLVSISGWSGAFSALSAVALFTTGFGLLFLLAHARPRRAPRGLALP